MARSGPSVFFPQLCTHVSCTFDSRGLLRAAMIAADRLLFFHDGTLCADAVLCGDGAVRELRLCDFSDETRVAVVRSNGVWLVDLTAPAMHMTQRHVFVPALASSLHEAVDAAFVTRASLAMLFSDEAVVVDVPDDDSSHSGTVRWRHCGSYGAVAVCRASLHLAFALRSSVIEVFPLKVHPDTAEAVESPIFSPTHALPSLSTPVAAAAHGFARRGVSASLGIYRAAAIAWHHTRQHTILCVTCEHPKDGLRNIALFTLQSVPPLVPHMDSDCPDGSHGYGRCSEALQLVPVGTIDLGATPRLAAQIVPNLSRARIAASLDNSLEVFCVTRDGTTSTISCRFGQQCQLSFMKEDCTELHCQQLLQPLMARFGAISRIELLPIWKSRVVKFGTCTPQAERLLGTMRYRILTHFTSGLVAVVMIDIMTPTVRVEAFLTLGRDDAPLRLAPGRESGEWDSPRLLLGFAQDRVFVLARQLCGAGHEETRVVAIAPIAPEHRKVISEPPCAVDAVAESTAGTSSTEERVRHFMAAKCPEKTRMLPALLRACNGDAERLLTQLIAKYGPIDSTASPPPPLLLLQKSEATAAATTGVPGEICVEDVYAAPDGIFFATRVAGAPRRLWRVPLDPLESFSAAHSELFVHNAQLPSIAPIQRAAVPESDAPDTTDVREGNSAKETAEKSGDDTDEEENAYEGEIQCKLTDNGGVSLCGATLPECASLSLQPFDAAVLLDARVLRLANNGIVLAAIGTAPRGNAGHERLLRLYGLSLLRDIRAGPRFALELELRGAFSVFLRRDGEAFVLRRDEATSDSRHDTAHATESAVIERWVRFAVDGTDVHEWRRCNETVCGLSETDITKDVDRANATPSTDKDKLLRATAMTVLSPQRNSGAAGCELLVYTPPDGSCVYASPLQEVCDDTSGAGGGGAGVPCYHPASLLLLLGMGRGAIVSAIAEDLLAAAERAAGSECTQCNASHAPHANIPAREEERAGDSARELCRCAISGRLGERPSAADAVSLTPLSIPAPFAILSAPLAALDENVFGGALPADVLGRLAAALPASRLAGLDAQAQLELLCVIDALRTARAGGDAAAAHFFFLYRMQQLRRRLPARGATCLSPPHAAALWAALSDAQSVVVEELFGATQSLAWEDVDAAHVPFWLSATHVLRALAERLARAQYQATRDVRDCALMYCLARKVGVLTALCKAERNVRLVAFFSRDFREERHRQAAAANGFAAVSKNQPLFGAAFFVLAGDARSAAQVVLQRHGSVGLALLVLRLAGDDGPSDMSWFAEQRQHEAAACGAVDAWESACLAWRAGEPRRALDAIARRPASAAADAVERMALLRYEARRGRSYSAGITPQSVMQGLVRAARFASGAGLRIPAALLYADARGVLDTLRKGDGNDRGKDGAMSSAGGGGTGMAKRRAPLIEADFNTGSLKFHGFDDDDESDEDERNESRDDNKHISATQGNDALALKDPHHTQVSNSLPLASSPSSSSGAAVESGGDDEDGLLHPVTAETVELEMRSAACWLRGRKGSARREKSSYWKSALLAACRLTATVGRHAPIACVERDLATLTRALNHTEQFSERPAHEQFASTESAHGVGSGMAESSSVTARVVIAATRLALVSVVEQNADYALAIALLTFDTMESVIRETSEVTVSIASAAAYVRVVRETLCRVRDMVDERASSGHADLNDATSLPSSCGSLSVWEEAQLRSMLLAWFAAYMHARTIAELREVVGVVTAGHFTYDTRLHWLLACALCRATLRFDAAAAELIARVISVRHLDDSLLSNPNGVFVEEAHELRRGAQLLEANLSVDPHSSSGCPSAGSVLLDLCVARAELFWQLPSALTPMSDEVDAATAVLQSATRPHAAAHLLYGQLINGAATTLRRMESAWLRRHHTHRGYREMLIARGLGKTRGTVTTDRLVLHQAHHTVCSVGFDQSTCDSLVWGTDAGVAVVHGYREILAGDNEAALLLEQTERNIAAAAFTAVRGGGHCVGQDTKEKGNGGGMGLGSEVVTPLSRRPRSSIAAHAHVASHPYLPFFLARHGDEFVDMYSFSETKCAATFRCRGSYAVTDVAYSPNGHLFVLGLADGSVSGWRFALRPARGGAPLFTHRLLPPGGVVAALFCGACSSLLVIVGAERAKAAERDQRGEGFSPIGRRGSASASHSGSGTGALRRRIGVLLIVDLVMREGAVIVRCELPFAPDFATYFSSLHSVLCVTTDARAAIYDMRSGRLCVIASEAIPRLLITCIAASRYDDLVALGTDDGHALLLRGCTVCAACANSVQQDSAGEVDRENRKDSLLDLAVNVQVAPTLSTHSGVRCLAFTPSVLLAGLADGKTVAATLVPAAVR